ncbi:MAG: Gfo/Idh/MocA family oxidoreductase [Paracoccaceae bacterium]
MAKDIRWGILGAAKIARTDVAPAIHAAQGATLAAIATRDPSRAAPFLAIAPELTVYSDYDALLADPAIDAVYIPLPNHLHVDWTLRALAAGKHVLCEKPIALTADQIDRLIAARDASGLLAAEAFMVVHHPQWTRVREMLAEGAIGRLQHVEGMFTYNNPNLANYRNHAEFGGGGLRDVGVYPCVTTRFATGVEPLAIRSDLRLENGVDTFARVWADFPDFTMSFYCGMRQLRRQSMLFHGTEGFLELTAPFNPLTYGDAELRLKTADGRLTIERQPPVDQYRRMIEAFGHSVATGADFACPLEFSRGNQAMIDAILAASGG